MGNIIRFVHVGHQNMVNLGRVVAILPSGTANADRFCKAAKQTNTYIDATHARPRRSVLLMDDGRVVGSTLNPRVLLKRFNFEGIIDAFDPDSKDEKEKVSLDLEEIGYDDDEDDEDEDEYDYTVDEDEEDVDEEED